MEILFENRDVVVCLKPAGVLSEDAPAARRKRTDVPARAETAVRLAGASAAPAAMPALLRAHWGRPDAPVYPVHRLDTGASGVMVYAKTRAAAAALSAQIQSGGFRKEYRCVCAGVPAPPCGEMRDWLFKDSRSNKVFCVRGARRGAKEALLDYEVLAVCGADPSAAPAGAGGFALCAVRLHTGRTHQIRVQFASRRHPLCGDGKYGSREKGALALWCARLTFVLPGAEAPRSFFAPQPAEGAFARFAADAAASFC